jgi:tetratricopeptide (TPR) repeat protein
VKEEFHRLHTLVKRNPRKAIAELPGWIERYPNLPILYNYLSAAYAQTGARRQAEQTILENLQRNPDYLFARLNYAEICLARQDYQGGAKVLENKFDLKWLYPRRKIFHVSEYVGFMSVVGRYYAAIGERDEAEKIYEELKKIDPHDRGTRSLRDTLHPSLRQRIARWLLKDTPARQSKNE